MSDSISNALLKSIEYIVENKASQLLLDRTVVGTIVSCSNMIEREYKISYQGGYFYAYAQEGESYTQNTSVYVLVPESDFSKTKLIVGKAQAVSDDKNISFVSSALSDYSIVGNNTIIDKKNGLPLGLSSYKARDVKFIYTVQDEDSSLVQINQEELKQYIVESEAVMIEASFRSNLLKEHQKNTQGMYALVFNLAFNDNDKVDEDGNPATIVRSYVLDSAHMSGQPLNFQDYSDQYLLFDIDKENYLFVDSIIFYEEGFVTEDDISKIALRGNEIFVKDLEFYGLKKISSTQGDYSLTVGSPQGLIFKTIDQNKSLDLVAQLLYQKQVNLTDSAMFYWFIEDSRVDASSEFYQMYGGRGWRYLKDKGKTGDFTTYDYENLAKENKYLCCCVYEQTVILKLYLTIYNTAADIDLEIHSDLGTEFAFDRGVPTLTCLVGGEENPAEEFTFAWARVDELGVSTPLKQNYEDLVKEKEAALAAGASYFEIADIELRIAMYKDISIKRNVLKLPINQITDKVTIKCSVYKKGSYVGTAETTLRNQLAVAKEDYYIVIENGDQVFQYSESGVSPASEKYTDPLEVKPLTCHLFDPAGLEVTKEKYKVIWRFPITSTLITEPAEATIENQLDAETKYYTEPIYPLSIAKAYDYSALNNQVEAVVTYNGKELIQSSNLLFTKQGNNGTNGTDITTKITYQDYNYIVNNKKYYPALGIDLSKGLNPIWSNGQRITAFPFGVDLYRQNEKLDTSGVKDNIIWSILGGISKVLTYDSNAKNLRYIDQASQNINLQRNQILKTSLYFEQQAYYSFYSIPIVDYQQQGYKVILDKHKLLKEVIYNADGYQPLYNRNQGIPLTIFSGQTDISEKCNITYIAKGGGISHGENFPDFTLAETNDVKVGTKTVATNKPFIYIIPNDIYSGEYCNNRVEVTINYNGKTIALLYIPIRFGLNTYGLASLNQWDGNHVQIDEEGGFILAPQIGAGKKDSLNKFTGVVMGVAKRYESIEQIGLLGYSEGKQSIFLDAQNGNATFGLPEDGKGQIRIRPSGTSSISGWKMNLKSFYNVKPSKSQDPNAEIPLDRRKWVSGSEGSVPFSNAGIHLSADPVFFSIKGRPWETTDMPTGEDEKANLIMDVGDSLELELNPNSATGLFTIYRHYMENGTWKRNPSVGIDNKGRFYTNAIKDSSVGLYVGKVGAFGYNIGNSSNPYIGSQFEIDESVFIKFFKKGRNGNNVYITTSGSPSNEYNKSMSIHGREINLYAGSGTSETTDNRLNLDSYGGFLGNTSNHIKITSSGTNEIISGRPFNLTANGALNFSATRADTTFNDTKNFTVNLTGNLIVGTATGILFNAGTRGMLSMDTNGAMITRNSARFGINSASGFEVVANSRIAISNTIGNLDVYGYGDVAIGKDGSHRLFVTSALTQLNSGSNYVTLGLSAFENGPGVGLGGNTQVSGKLKVGSNLSVAGDIWNEGYTLRTDTVRTGTIALNRLSFNTAGDGIWFPGWGSSANKNWFDTVEGCLYYTRNWHGAALATQAWVSSQGFAYASQIPTDIVSGSRFNSHTHWIDSDTRNTSPGGDPIHSHTYRVQTRTGYPG